MLVALLTGASNGRQNVSLISKTTVLSLPSFYLFFRWYQPLPCLYFFFFFARSTQADSWQTISRWPHHLSCNFFGGEKTIRWMPCIMFIFFPLFPSLDFTLKSLIGLRKGLLSRLKQRFVHAWKLCRSRNGPRWFKSLRSGLILFSASWHGAGIQYYRQAGHQMGVGFISVSLSSHPPSPLAGCLIQVCLIFSMEAPTECPRTRCPWAQNNFSGLILWLIISPPPLLLLFSCFSLTVVLVFLFPRSLFVFMPKSLGRGERLQLQRWRPLWQNTEYVFNYLDFLMLLSSHRKYCSCSDVPIMFSFECLLTTGSPTPSPPRITPSSPPVFTISSFSLCLIALRDIS